MKLVAAVVVPAHDADRVRHEAGNIALNNSVIADDDVRLLDHVRLEGLGKNCKKQKEDSITIWDSVVELVEL